MRPPTYVAPSICRMPPLRRARGRFTEKTSSFTLHSFLGWLSIIGPSNHHDSAERYLVLCIYYYLVCNKKQQKYIRNQHIVRKKQLRGKNMWYSKFLPWEAVYHWAKQVSWQCYSRYLVLCISYYLTCNKKKNKNIKSTHVCIENNKVVISGKFVPSLVEAIIIAFQ